MTDTRSLDRRTLLAVALSVLPASSGLMAAEPVSPPRSDFDFLLGRWNVNHRKLRHRLTGSTDWFEFSGTLDVRPILGGASNIDLNEIDDPAGRYTATSLRIYDEAEKSWSIYWIDERLAGLDKPMIGRFVNGVGEFFTSDEFGGRAILVRFKYECLDPRHAMWSQAFSPDAGASWETNWIMEFSRAKQI